jgi:hypothetical protein
MFMVLITFSPCYREIPLYFGKHRLRYCVVLCECDLLLWTIFSVYRDHISPLKSTLAKSFSNKYTAPYSLYMVSTTLYTSMHGINNSIHVYTGINNTRVYTVLTTLCTCIHGINNTRVYRVLIINVYTGYH